VEPLAAPKRTAGVSPREKYSSQAARKPAPVARQNREGPCSVEGCDRPIHSRRLLGALSAVVEA
jgi:hypothetical protein